MLKNKKKNFRRGDYVCIYTMFREGGGGPPLVK